MGRTQRFALQLAAGLLAAAAASFSVVTDAHADCPTKCKLPEVCRYAAESGKFYCALPTTRPKAKVLSCSAATEPEYLLSASAWQAAIDGSDPSAEVEDDE